MKSIISLLCCCSLLPVLQAQQIKIYGGGQMSLSSGNQLAWSGLTLTPTSNFNTGSSLEQSTTTTIGFPSTYVQRVYRFDPATDPFNGSIRIAYLDAELNGLDKNSLELFINNGSSWKGFPSTLADPSLNYLQADGIGSQLLGELLLAANSALPLTWGQASLLREGALVKIRWTTSQEINVSHFDIERSTDASNWRISIPGIPAKNQLSENHYEATDHPDLAGKLFYRVRQTDIDGRHSFSRILVAPAANSLQELSISPNPAKGYFLLDWPDISGVSALQLISHQGQVIHSWQGGKYQYELPTVPAGTYFIRIMLKDGSSQTRKLQLK